MSSKSDDDKASGSEDSSSPVTESVTESPDSKNEKADSDTETKNDDGDIVANKDDSVKNKDSSDEENVSPRMKRVTRKSIRKQEVDQQRESFLSMDLESKRKLYRSKYTTLEEVQTWPLYYAYFLKVNPKAAKQLAVSGSEEKYEVRDDLNKKISIFHGDITTLEIDAIANAANESLLGGGGVDGAIHRAAGPHLLAECETLDGCAPGDAKITCGYKLPAKYIIHTVGPRGEKPKVLKSCYVRCLELVKKHKLKTIAFPCISTGIFGYPNTRAAKVVLNTLREWLETDEYAANVESIILCLFQKVDEDIYKKLLPIYFPVGSGVNAKSNQKSSAESTVHEEASNSTEKKNDNKKEIEIIEDKP